MKTKREKIVVDFQASSLMAIGKNTSPLTRSSVYENMPQKSSARGEIIGIGGMRGHQSEMRNPASEMTQYNEDHSQKPELMINKCNINI